MTPTTMVTRRDKIRNKTVFISCIVPIYNESDLIEKFLYALEQELQEITSQYEIVTVDDGSHDQSASLVEQYIKQHSRVKLISFSRNFGKEMAIAAGLNHIEGEVGIIIDADFQHPLEYIPTFLEKWGEGYDMVYGLRKDRSHESFLKRNLSHLFYRLLDWITEVNIPRHAGDFRLIDQSAIQALNQCKERARMMKGLYAWVGFKSIAVPIVIAKRAAGLPNYRLSRLTSLAINGFISFSDLPLRIWSSIGILICGFSLLAILYIVMDTIAFGAKVPGYATLLCTIVFFGGVQLLSIGILGEYVSRIFNEVKRRPPYIIQRRIGFDSSQDDL